MVYCWSKSQFLSCLFVYSVRRSKFLVRCQVPTHPCPEYSIVAALFMILINGFKYPFECVRVCRWWAVVLIEGHKGRKQRIPNFLSPSCRQDLEHADCIPCNRIPPPGVRDRRGNWVCEWGSSSGDLGSVEYHCHYSQVHTDLERYYQLNSRQWIK